MAGWGGRGLRRDDSGDFTGVMKMHVMHLHIRVCEVCRSGCVAFCAGAGRGYRDVGFVLSNDLRGRYCHRFSVERGGCKRHCRQSAWKQAKFSYEDAAAAEYDN